MRKRRMVRMPKRYREEKFIRMNPGYSADIHVTASVEAEFRLIAQNRKMKEEEKIEIIKVDARKRAAHMNQRRKLIAKLVEANTNLPNEIMASEEHYNPLLKVLLSLSTDTIKDSYKHLGGKMGKLPDHKKRTVAAAIVRK